VLLNRAPTLHRLGIQAFEPVLIEGSAIQLHPLVCKAFNADFDGDQMAVHVPLSREAVAEARQVMLSTKNLLSPSSGEPTVAPTLDMVLGCYYMTDYKPHGKGAYQGNGQSAVGNGDGGRSSSLQGVYGSFEEAKYAYSLDMVDLRAPIRVRDQKTNGELIVTSVGRIIFNDVLPEEVFYDEEGNDTGEMKFWNELMDRKELSRVVTRCYQRLGNDLTADVVDELKKLGFRFATRSGITIAVNDLKVPAEKQHLLEAADEEVERIEEQYQFGEITDDERYEKTVQLWTKTTDEVTSAIQKNLRNYGSVYIMANSGAKGSIAQIRQMAGMRGLMTDPSGQIIDLPIRASFREGLSVLEYFISTHGARKGLADTALRTADSGYLTRRLIDVAQETIILEEDCGTENGITLTRPSVDVLESMRERIIGRITAADVVTDDGEVIVDRGVEITEKIAEAIDAAGIEEVDVRSPLACEAPRGLCRMCYGRDLATGKMVEFNAAVGIVAAQSIGEPGTQLTMRTFHTGGVAGGQDITSGLPRVEEVFEARDPKGRSVMTEIDGVVELIATPESRKVRVVSTEVYRDDYELPAGAELLVTPGQMVDQGTLLAQPAAVDGETPGTDLTLNLMARISGRIEQDSPNTLTIYYEEREQRDYTIPAAAQLLVRDGDAVRAGDKLTEGSKNPQDILLIQGRDAVQEYLVEEVQKVYRTQGVNINDKHIEVIVRQMLRRVRIDTPGDTALLPGELVDRFEYEELNRKVLAEGGEPATAQPVLLGVTKASLSTDSFLAAASFQETTRVLTEAAINGKVDQLRGLKENVIIGKLIPARAELDLPPLPPKPPREALPGFFAEGGLRELTRAETDGEGGAEGEEEFAENRGLRLLQAEDRGVDLGQEPLEEVESIAPIEATGGVALAIDEEPEDDLIGDGEDEDEE
ncbi:MAG: DNA-directed RNA polymerase subunit beta', partial [Dehalococcoidia bacterium]